MPFTLYLGVVFIFVVAVAGCPGQIPKGDPGTLASKGSPAFEVGGEHPIGTFEIMGTVIYEAMEGGFYAIHGNDGRKYDPLNLPEPFRKEGLKVRVGARLKEDAVSFHMYGIVIEVVNISAQ